MTEAKWLSTWTSVPTLSLSRGPQICAQTTGLPSAELPFLCFRVSSPRGMNHHT